MALLDSRPPRRKRVNEGILIPLNIAMDMSEVFIIELKEKTSNKVIIDGKIKKIRN